MILWYNKIECQHLKSVNLNEYFPNDLQDATKLCTGKDSFKMQHRPMDFHVIKYEKFTDGFSVFIETNICGVWVQQKKYAQ